MAAVLLDALKKVVTLSESQFELPEHVLADITRLATNSGLFFQQLWGSHLQPKAAPC